ncbi:MAG: hypothetical protein OXG68_13665 [Chloroflexi bacterium]|nr:hypothetical protein [Chloroflexota bacterium]
MPAPKSPPTAPVPRQRDEANLDELTDAQKEFMEDLRVSLIQMKNGDVMPARDALREIEREISERLT